MCEWQDELVVGIVLNQFSQYWLECIWDDGEIDGIDSREVDFI